MENKKDPHLLLKSSMYLVSIRRQVQKTLKEKLGLFFLKKFLEKHPFQVSTLIKPDGNSTIFEVEELYYDRNLEPVTIVKKYGQNGLFSFRNDSLLGFKEYKKIPSEDVVEL